MFRFYFWLLQWTC